MKGFLPIHCIHQLLKSRAFAKHNVNIKNWIYKQICTSVSPLHPVLPMLVEVYVNSILLPNAKNIEHTNKPLTENEIRKVMNIVSSLSISVLKIVFAGLSELDFRPVL